MDFSFQAIDYDREGFPETGLPSFPKRSGVYKIFDTRGKLIVLDKSSNLQQRMERFYGPRCEMLRDLDLREITSRIEFRPSDSTFETLYLLYRERRTLFPKTYRKMRTFRFFTLLKINGKQRFPRFYASRQIKAGVDYFGPFISRGQFARLKTSLERTFQLRPCLYNIRGNDPHPDCLYFQMHTCSRPCNNDIDRSSYTEDVRDAIAFIQGQDQEIEDRLAGKMSRLASETRFEEAESLRRRLTKIERARHETKDTFHSIWNFNAVVLLAANSVSQCKAAFVRQGAITAFHEYEVESLQDKMPEDLAACFAGPLDIESREWQYDEFCLVANFIVNPLQNADIILVNPGDDIPQLVLERIQQRKRKRKPIHVDTVA